MTQSHSGSLTSLLKDYGVKNDKHTSSIFILHLINAPISGIHSPVKNFQYSIDKPGKAARDQ